MFYNDRIYLHIVRIEHSEIKEEEKQVYNMVYAACRHAIQQSKQIVTILAHKCEQSAAILSQISHCKKHRCCIASSNEKWRHDDLCSSCEKNI